MLIALHDGFHMMIISGIFAKFFVAIDLQESMYVVHEFSRPWHESRDFRVVIF